MAYRDKKDLNREYFDQCNELLGKQITEVCDGKQDIYNFKMAENSSEFFDGHIYDTYNSLQVLFQNMYDENVDSKINSSQRMEIIYSDEEEYTKELIEVEESLIDYSKEIDYRFGDLGNTGNVGNTVSIGNVGYINSIASYMIKRRLTREEFNRYKKLLNKISTGDPFSGLTDEDKIEFVELYEKLYPLDKKKMSSISSIFENDGYDGYEIDLMNIKILAYTAEEPYKSIYLDNISKVTEGDLHYSGGSYASGGKFFVTVDDWDDKSNSATYSTFFHETTHCIDYFLGGEDSYVSKYTDSNGKTLNNILEDDVRQRINNEIDDYFKTQPKLTEAEKKAIRVYVEDSIMNQVDYRIYGEPDFSMIVGKDSIVIASDVRLCYREVRVDINSQVIGFARDNYGGLTGNTVVIGDGGIHQAIIKNEDEYRVYWMSGEINETDGTDLYITLDNNENFKETIDIKDESQRIKSNLDERVIMSDAEVVYKDRISKEFFANSMSAKLSQDRNDLTAYNFYYPDTIDYYEELLNTIKVKGD